MKINKISYSKSYEMWGTNGKAFWEKIGVEAELDNSENPESGLQKLKDIVEDFHQKSNPQPEFVQDTFSQIIAKKSGARLEPDISARKQYAEAASKQDHETIRKLETIYNFQIC